jgi:hypothetical protein
MTHFIRRQMRDNLMSKEIEIYPFGRTSALGAAEQVTVKLAGTLQVVDWKRQVERL